MLTEHQNAFLHRARTLGYDPGMFRVKTHTVERVDFFCIALRQEQKLFFHAANSPDTFHRFFGSYSQFTPKFQEVKWPQKEMLPLSGALRVFGSWLKENVRVAIANSETPDLWAQVEQVPPFLLTVAAVPRDVENRYSEEEIRHIKSALDTFRLLIQKEFSPTDEQLRLVDERLGYLSEALHRLNRFDWASVAVSTVVTIATALSLDTEKGRQLWGLLQQALSGVLRLIGA